MRKLCVPRRDLFSYCLLFDSPCLDPPLATAAVGASITSRDLHSQNERERGRHLGSHDNPARGREAEGGESAFWLALCWYLSPRIEPDVLLKQCYFFDSEVGSFFYAANHPMKPRRPFLLLLYAFVQRVQLVFTPAGYRSDKGGCRHCIRTREISGWTAHVQNPRWRIVWSWIMACTGAWRFLLVYFSIPVVWSYIRRKRKHFKWIPPLFPTESQTCYAERDGSIPYRRIRWIFVEDNAGQYGQLGKGANKM